MHAVMLISYLDHEKIKSINVDMNACRTHCNLNMTLLTRPRLSGLHCNWILLRVKWSRTVWLYPQETKSDWQFKK